MQETQTSDKSIEEDMDFESFRDVQEEYKADVQHGRVGTARLESCEIIEQSEIPDFFKKRSYTFSKKYFKFDAQLSNTNKNIKVICPAKDEGINIRTAMEWAGAAEVSELAGKRVPITHISEDYYKIEAFDNKGNPNLSLFPTPVIKSMVDSDFLEFKSGRWSIPPTVLFSGLLIIASMFFLPYFIASILPSQLLSTSVLMVYPAILFFIYKMKRE